LSGITLSARKPLRSYARGGERRILETSEGQFFVASYIPRAPDTGQSETLVFRSDADGEIEDWGEVCGGPGFSVADAEKELLAVLNGAERTWEPDLADMIAAIGVIAYPPGPDYYADEEEETP